MGKRVNNWRRREIIFFTVEHQLILIIVNNVGVRNFMNAKTSGYTSSQSHFDDEQDIHIDSKSLPMKYMLVNSKGKKSIFTVEKPGRYQLNEGNTANIISIKIMNHLIE